MRFRDCACSLAISAAAILCYWNSLECGLVFDDLAAIRDNRDVRANGPISNIFLNDFWGTPIRKEESHKSYRPLTILTFRLNYWIHGLSPFGYHLPNVILHALVCLLFHRVCLLLFRHSTAFLSAISFAVHPIHTEAVTGVVGRAELLSALFYLCAFLFYASLHKSLSISDIQRTGITAALAGLGMLCKEQAITVLLLCIAYEVFLTKISSKSGVNGNLRKEKTSSFFPWVLRCWRKCSLLTLWVIVILCMRAQVVGTKTPVFSRLENPASVSKSPNRQLTYNYLLAINAWLLLFPMNLCCDWTMGSVPVIRGILDMRNVYTAILYLGIVALCGAAYRFQRINLSIAMSLCMVVVPLLPALNLFFPVGFVIAERVLYLPSMGFCMLFAHGWSSLWKKSSMKNFALIGLILLFSSHAWKTTSRNVDWKDELSLFSSALKVNRNNAKLLNNMGKALEAIPQMKDEALKYYEEATRIQPDDVRGYLNLGRILTSVERYSEAENIYRKAKSLIPIPDNTKHQNPGITSSHLQVFLHLASLVAKNQSRLEEADDLYLQVLKFKSDFTNAYMNRGDILRRMNRTTEAEAMYKRALLSDDSNPDLYFNLAVIVMDQGRVMEALQLFDKALDIDPEHQKALVNSALLIQEAGMSHQRTTAIHRLQKVVQKGEANEKVYFELGMLTLENSDVDGAEFWLRRAIEANFNSSSALFNMALLLSERIPEESLLYLERLLQIHPHHAKGLLLSADISVTHLKDFDTAEELYRRVLALDPKNVQALHNLCVVQLERGDVYAAEQCFLEAVGLHPEVQFIQNNLATTRELLHGGLGNYGMPELSASPTTAVR